MSEVFAQLWASYVTNRLFMGVHAVLLLWACAVFLWGMWSARRDRVWLAERDPEATGRLASLWTTLRHGGNTGRLELRDLYDARASVGSDDLSRIANLLLLIGVAGTLWSLFGGARAVQDKPPGGDDVGAAQALLPVLRSFNAFSVTIVSVALAVFVLFLQRIAGRVVANVASDAARAWDGAGASVDSAAHQLHAAVGELATHVKALGARDDGEWARSHVQRLADELAASTQKASQDMVAASGAFARAFSDAVAPLAARVTTSLGPIVDRLDSVTTALEASTRSLEAQRGLLEKHAATLQVIDGHLGTAELAVEHLRGVPGVVGTSLQDIGKHVTGTLATLHGTFEGKLEQMFDIHRAAILTVAGQMREADSQLVSAVHSAKAEITQYLVHYGKNLSATVDDMLSNAARASDASVWTPVRRAVEDIGAVAQRTHHDVSTVEQTAVTAVQSVQRSVAMLGDRVRAFASQVEAMHSAVIDGARSPERRSAAIAQWVSTGVLALAMVVLGTLVYTRLGQ
jgi:hypothetical protein